MLNQALFDGITFEDADTVTITPKQFIATIPPAIEAHTTSKPCPAIRRGRVRTYPITWS